MISDMLPAVDTDPRSDTGRVKTIAKDPRWPGPIVSPEEMLRAEFLEPLGLEQAEAANRMRIPANRLDEIVLGKRRVTAADARRLSRSLNTSPQFWTRLQADWRFCAASRFQAAGVATARRGEGVARTRPETPACGVESAGHEGPRRAAPEVLIDATKDRIQRDVGRVRPTRTMTNMPPESTGRGCLDLA